MPQSQAPITMAPPGSGGQGFQMGLGYQGLPTSGQGSALTSGLAGGFLRGVGGRIGGAMGVLGGLGAGAGVILRAAGSGIPDVEETIGRNTNYYQAALRNARGMTEFERATRAGLGMGITSRGSDALVAAALSNQGMVFSEDPNSTYMQTIRGVSTAAQYLNMDNMAAAMALEGLTSGAGSMNMLMQFGIHTSDPRSGRAYTQGQIFEQIAQRLTAGRGDASVEDTLESIRRGNLGETIRNIGLSTDQQELFKQFMISRAQGEYMDLSDADAMRQQFQDTSAIADRFNPQLFGMQMNAEDTAMMQEVTQEYIAGMGEAVQTLKDVNEALRLVPDGFLRLESQFSALQGTQGGRFIEEFVNAMPGAISGFIALNLLTMGSSGLSSVAQMLGAGSSDIPGIGEVSSVDLGSGRPTFVSPVGGAPVSSNGYFGPRIPTNGVGSDYHRGLDFAVPVGTSVVASAGGQVITSRSGGGYGEYILIQHSGGYQTLYAHLSRRLVSEGQSVSAGQQIGLSGNTGTSTGPHLHFEARLNGSPVDPAPLLGIPSRTNSSVSGGGATGGSMFIGDMEASSPVTVSSHSGASVFSGASSGGASGVHSSFSASGGSMGSTYLSGAPSAKTGDAYVANDGPVNVHAGEAILTAEQADDWRAMMRGERRGGRNNVTINVQLSNASDGEARRLATMVKQYLEEDNLLNNMGRK